MLTIKPHQSAMFVQVAVDRFVDELTAHLRQHFPQQFDALGEFGTHDAIRYGIRQARSYGIESEAGVRVFIRLMFMFGPTFDSELPWASRCLEPKTEEVIKVAELIAAARTYAQDQGHAKGRGP
jgi:hypothetical protein